MGETLDSQLMDSVLNLTKSAKIDESDIASIESIIKKGANPSANGSAVLSIMADKGRHIHLADLLVKHGAKPTDRGSAAFLLAISNGHESFAVFLLEQGADVHALNDAAFIVALGSENEDLLGILEGYIKNEVDLAYIAEEYASDSNVEEEIKARILSRVGDNAHYDTDMAVFSSFEDEGFKADISAKLMSINDSPDKKRSPGVSL